MKNTNTSAEETRILEALEEMKAKVGEDFSLASVNLAELERRTGVSRSKLRLLKRNGFKILPHASQSCKFIALNGFCHEAFLELTGFPVI